MNAMALEETRHPFCTPRGSVEPQPRNASANVFCSTAVIVCKTVVCLRH
jgi:hypothetical protein